MARRGRPPKKKEEKLTKRERVIKAFREERKKTSAGRKRTIIPGPWTDKETKLKLKPELKANQSVCRTIGEYYGIYRDNSNWNEKGWYPITINIMAKNLKQLVSKHGIDQVMAACEKGLNECLDEEKKKRFGHIILTYVFSDNSQRDNGFISCWAKTNKKRIVGFLTIRKAQLVVIKPLENTDPEDDEEN